MNPNPLEKVVELNQQGMLNKDIAKKLKLPSSTVSFYLNKSGINRVRKYRGFSSPLDYFNEHFKEINITRGQLSQKDNSLYQSLKRYRQFNQAFPDK